MTYEFFFHHKCFTALLPQHTLQKFDVLDRELEDLGLAQLLVEWMRWKQPSQLGKRPAHMLLAESFPRRHVQTPSNHV